MKVKFYLKKDEDKFQAEDKLYKALGIHRNGDIHEDEKFVDPAMNDLENKLALEHKQIYSEMMQEIFDELDKEYTDGNF